MSAKPAGHIQADCLYHIDDIKRLLGLGATALRTARRNGLVVKRIGRRSFVLGRDAIAYFERQGKLVP